MNTIPIELEVAADDFLSPQKAEAAVREWQAWYRGRVAVLGSEALLPLPGRRRDPESAPRTVSSETKRKRSKCEDELRFRDHGLQGQTAKSG